MGLESQDEHSACSRLVGRQIGGPFSRGSATAGTALFLQNSNLRYPIGLPPRQASMLSAGQTPPQTLYSTAVPDRGSALTPEAVNLAVKLHRTVMTSTSAYLFSTRGYLRKAVGQSAFSPSQHVCTPLVPAMAKAPPFTGLPAVMSRRQFADIFY